MSDSQSRRWAIVAHGGATEIADDQTSAYRQGSERAVAAGSAILGAGGSAMAAAVAAVRALEADRTFNAGIGAVLNSDGRVQCDAAVMDGTTLDIGAVAAVESVRHPVEVAAAMLREEQTLLVAAGAERFAREHGLDGPSLTPLANTSREPHDSHDTVGCVALDQDGHIATAISTGGLPMMPPGRIGDTPLPGCGFFADDAIGGVVLSGTGERIARLALAAWALERLGRPESDPVAVARDAIEHLGRVGGDAGIVAIDRNGRIGWAHNSPDFAVAWATDRQPTASFTRAEQPGGSESGRPEAS